ncbi:MAG: LuxR C-terminal-related transcriptional regulator [Owenweeksia sp.]|nr:LuxR C-terminal-related transcriptional regulator [Owenweeksia sp.]
MKEHGKMRMTTYPMLIEILLSILKILNYWQELLFSLEKHPRVIRFGHEHTNFIWKNGYFNSSIRCAFNISFTLFHKGEFARGNGWFARARSIFNEQPSDSVIEGFLLLPIALKLLSEGDAEASLTTFEEAGKIGDRFGDRDLITLTRLGRGQSLIRLRETKTGLAMLDEAMVALESGEVSPFFEGIVYCSVIESCSEIGDLNRARQWTEALNNWCESQPQMIPFRGECLVRRSEIMQMHGKWNKAFQEASQATKYLTESTVHPATGAAFYQVGELHRLRGDFLEAEDAYYQSIQWGRKIVPGLALLHLVKGNLNKASETIESTLKICSNSNHRSKILPAYIEIMLATNDQHKARSATEELREIAKSMDTSPIIAIASWWEGALLLHEEKFQKALITLLSATSAFEKLNAPYEIARIRVLIGKVYLQLGYADSAQIEFNAAHRTFHQLGAKPDISRVDALLFKKQPDRLYGLSPREYEVVQQISQGLPNKAIANELFISSEL